MSTPAHTTTTYDHMVSTMHHIRQHQPHLLVPTHLEHAVREYLHTHHLSHLVEVHTTDLVPSDHVLVCHPPALPDRI